MKTKFVGEYSINPRGCVPQMMSRFDYVCTFLYTIVDSIAKESKQKGYIDDYKLDRNISRSASGNKISLMLTLGGTDESGLSIVEQMVQEQADARKLRSKGPNGI